MYQLHAGQGSSHRLLADLVRRYGRSPVLDVGAAEGYLGRLLAGQGLVIDAIEPHEASATVAGPYYRHVHVTPVEGFIPDESYGTIILGDVLEHLVDPLESLKRLVGHLLPDGLVLVSLPNVAHLAVRLLLLAGRFPRMDRGPLDRTHLHFYTRTTAEKLLRDAGLQVVERRGTVVPIADILPGRWRATGAALAPVQRPLVRFMPGLFAYQWVFATSRSIHR